MYSQKVMDHFMNPRNVGRIDLANGIGEVGNPVCGDIMHIEIKVNDDNVIEDIKFNTFGCAAAIATSSMVTEMVKGKLWRKPSGSPTGRGSKVLSATTGGCAVGSSCTLAASKEGLTAP